MKKIFMLLSLVFITLSLVACNYGGGTSGGNQGSAEEKEYTLYSDPGPGAGDRRSGHPVYDTGAA